MKFAGQLKFPDIDHPGLPVVFLVEDDHASILLDGESLGRWALFDVEATRLVAKAFQVHLDGEEITFIAEEPIDFAYNGVEHMAQTWARSKALSLPRRTVAVRKIRRETRPSRLPELRAAVVENLEEPVAFEPIASPAPADQMPMAWESVETAPPPTEMVPDPEIVDIPAKARLIPGPGLVKSLAVGKADPMPVADLEETIEEPAEAAEVVEEPAEVPAAEVVEEPAEAAEVVEEPAEVPAAEVVEEPEEVVEVPAVEVVEEPVEVPAAEVVEEADEPDEESFQEPVPVIEGWLGQQEEAQQPEEVLTPWFAGADESEELPDSGDPIDWQYQPERLEQAEPAAASADDHDEDLEDLPEEVGDLIGTPAGSDEGLFVDLGRYEDAEEDDDDSPPEDGSPLVDREPVLVGTSHERSGLFGAVRSAFVRNRAPHEHEFMDAPGGMGLTRQICADCGHISIRSDD